MSASPSFPSCVTPRGGNEAAFVRAECGQYQHGVTSVSFSPPFFFRATPLAIIVRGFNRHCVFSPLFLTATNTQAFPLLPSATSRVRRGLRTAVPFPLNAGMKSRYKRSLPLEGSSQGCATLWVIAVLLSPSFFSLPFSIRRSGLR